MSCCTNTHAMTIQEAQYTKPTVQNAVHNHLARQLTDFAVAEPILLGVAHRCAAAVLGADLLDGAESAAQALVPMNLRSHTPLLVLAGHTSLTLIPRTPHPREGRTMLRSSAKARVGHVQITAACFNTMNKHMVCRCAPADSVSCTSPAPSTAPCQQQTACGTSG